MGGNHPLKQRRAGVLLHPTSLPGPQGQGDLGASARRFVDWLVSAGLGMWQVLPLGPTHGTQGSPYQTLSLHAGNPLLISLEALVTEGWLVAVPQDTQTEASQMAQLAQAWAGFQHQASASDRVALQQFQTQQAHWLEDYALFASLKQAQGGKPWWEWPVEWRRRAPGALARARQDYAAELALQVFVQFVFFRQWAALKAYAQAQGVLLFGDLPIFPAHDSAEVWACQPCFLLNQDGQPEYVAGVPPDYFSAEGQRWGNPVYRWEYIEDQEFAFWVDRLRTQLEFYDLVRLDHFRGFEAAWHIPATATTGVEGQWFAGPGERLFNRLADEFGSLPLVAEDLGYITEPVRRLRRQFGFPGMKILQFAFDGRADNAYLPHQHSRNCVVYTGTHDNDTTLGWFRQLDWNQRQQVMEYLGQPSEPMPWPLIRAAFASRAFLAIVPMQDLLALDSRHRMNQPGTTEGNWGWRFEWSQVAADLAGRVRRLAQLYRRLEESPHA